MPSFGGVWVRHKGGAVPGVPLAVVLREVAARRGVVKQAALRAVVVAWCAWEGHRCQSQAHQMGRAPHAPHPMHQNLEPQSGTALA